MLRMNVEFRLLAALLGLFLLAAIGGAAAQSSEFLDDDEQAQLRERAQNSVEILEEMLSLEAGLRQQIEALGGAEAVTTDETEADQLERLQRDLRDKQDQIATVLTGISESDYLAMEAVEFDLNAEAQELIEPFVLVLNEATSAARQIERTRRDLDLAADRPTDRRRARHSKYRGRHGAGDQPAHDRATAGGTGTLARPS